MLGRSFRTIYSRPCCAEQELSPQELKPLSNVFDNILAKISLSNDRRSDLPGDHKVQHTARPRSCQPEFKYQPMGGRNHRHAGRRLAALRYAR